MKKIYILTMMLLSVALSANSQLLLNENFDYGSSAGSLVTLSGGSWVLHNGTAGTLAYQTSGLSMTGYASSGVGGSTIVNGAQTEDAHRVITSQTSGSVYASALINVASATTTENYFMHFMSGTSIFYSKLYGKDDGAGNLKLGIQEAGGGTAGAINYASDNLSYNTTYLVVIKYNFTAGEASLFVLSSVTTTEPSASAVSSDGTNSTGFDKIALRQSANIPVTTVDGLRVANTWADLFPATTGNPVVSFSASSRTRNESNTANDTVWINLSQAATQTDSIFVVSADITATYGSEYTLTPNLSLGDTLIVNSGDTKAYFIANMIDNATNDGNVSFYVKVTGVSAGLDLGSTDSLRYTILDDELVLPIYNIATVTTSDVNGVADSLNVMCRLTGIVYGDNFRLTQGGTSFTVIDNTGGINCYNLSKTFGYFVTEGDSVLISGTVTQFNGLTQFSMDTIIFISANHTLKTPTVVTVLDETTESELVTLQNVYLTNPSQWAAAGSGFNVTISDGTNTYTMRIDDDCDLFQESAPDYMFNLTGIGGQFDNSSPYTSGYQILPRGRYDIDSVGIAPEPPAIPSYDIATVRTVDANGVADSLGVVCKLTGKVYGINYAPPGLSFTIIDNTGGIGIYKSGSNLGYTVTEGDEVSVYGVIGQFNGLTQVYADSIKLLSTGNTLKNATIVTQLNESTESDLVQIVNVSIVDASKWFGDGGSFTVKFTDGIKTFDVRIDNDCELSSASVPTGQVIITGIGGQFDNSSPYTDGYQLFPRYAADIVPYGAVNSIKESQIKIYPNPSNGEFTIETSAPVKGVKIKDILGKTLSNSEYASNANTLNLNIKNLEKGIYFVELQFENSSAVEKIVVK